MFKKIKYTVLAGIFTAVAARAQDVNFVASADKKYDGNKIVMYNNSTNDIDSAVFKDGKLAIKVKFKEPTVYYFYSALENKMNGGYSPFGILVGEPGTIQINANVEDFASSKISGSKENDLYNAFIEKTGKEEEKIMDQLYQKYGKEMLDNPDPDTTDVRFQEMMIDYERLSEEGGSQSIESMKQFILAHPDFYAAVHLLVMYGPFMKDKEVEDLYSTLSPRIKNTGAGKAVAAEIETKNITAIGKVAPDFTHLDTKGNMVKLSSLRGQYVLIDFWASWCGPCRAENPNVLKAYHSFKENGFTVLGVSIDSEKDHAKWLQAIKDDAMPWTQLIDSNKKDPKSASNVYGVKSIPTNFLLDPDGKIIARDLRGEELEAELSKLFGKGE